MELSNLLRKSQKNNGFILFALIGVMVVVSIFAFSIDKYTRSKLHHNHHLQVRYSSIAMAASIINYAVSCMQNDFEKPSSQLFKLFTDDELGPGQDIPLKLPELENILSEFPNFEAQLQVRIKELNLLKHKKDIAITGYDPLEKNIKLVFNVVVSYDFGKYSRVEERECRLISLMPDVLGKFTLFIKQPEDLNQFANHIDGFPDNSFSKGSSCQPIILKNGGDLDFAAAETSDPDSWRKRGYIYLGGDEVVLNLTGGNFEGYGELFHFYSMDKDAGIPGYYPVSSPSFFAESPDFSKGWAQTLNSGSPFSNQFSYFIKRVISGYYTTQDNGQDMNYDLRLNVSFPEDEPDAKLKMRSSSIHLFGTKSNPSPTLVLGNVSRQYVEFAGILVDVDQDGSRDAIVDYIKESSVSLAEIPAPPEEIFTADNGSVQAGLSVKIDTSQVNYPNMFMEDPIYADYMCCLKKEPYLRSHDFLYFCPEDNYFPDQSTFGSKTAELQSKFSIKFNTNLFPNKYCYKNGDPSAYDPEKLFEKAVYLVKNQEEFYDRFILEDKILNLGSAVLIDNSDEKRFILPSSLSIAKGGIIILEKGNLELGSITREDPDEVLTIIVKNGDLVVNLSSQSPIYANLIALNGTIRNQNVSKGLDLYGSLCLKSYQPSNFKFGGRIAYEERNDPSSYYFKNYYRCFITDYACLTKIN